MDRFDLGDYRRPVSTRSPETQRWFNIGLNRCYGFNHEEGLKCFEQALESDPACDAYAAFDQPVRDLWTAMALRASRWRTVCRAEVNKAPARPRVPRRRF